MGIVKTVIWTQKVMEKHDISVLRNNSYQGKIFKEIHTKQLANIISKHKSCPLSLSPVLQC